MSSSRTFGSSSPLLHTRLNRRRAILGGVAGGAALFNAPAIRRTALAQDKVKLRFMHWGSLLEKDVMATTVKKFNESHADIEVEQLYTPGDYPTKLNTLAAANDLPDVFYQTPSDTLRWAEEGRVLDLTSFVAETPELKNRLPQSFFYYEPGKIGGAMLAGEMCTLFYNKDLFDEAGVEYPPATAATAWTWDQFVATAKSLTFDNKGRNAADAEFDGDNIKQFGVTFNTGWLFWYPMIRGNGADITDADGMQYTLNSPEAVDLFQKLQDLIYVHKVSPTPIQTENLPATEVQLETRRTAIAIAGQWKLLDVAAAKINFSVGVLPAIGDPKTVFQCNGSAINAATEHLDAAKTFYLFHNDPAKNMDPYATGLWMPLELKYYKEDEFIKQWTDNDVHPPEYVTAVIDYTADYSVPAPTVLFKNYSAIDSRIVAGLGDLWTGKKNAQDTLDALKDSVEPELQGRYPTE